MGVKIGYPDQWKDYTNFSIQAKEDGGSLLSNIDTIRMSKLKEEFAELNKPFDKTHFGMPAHAVNAFTAHQTMKLFFQQVFYKHLSMTHLPVQRKIWVELVLLLDMRFPMRLIEQAHNLMTKGT